MSSQYRIYFSAFLFLLNFCLLGAQTGNPAIKMNVEKEATSSKSRLLTMVVSLKNDDAKFFSGKLEWALPKGFKAISGDHITVNLQQGEQKYIPVRIMVDANANAGSSALTVRLLDPTGLLLAEQTRNHIIDVNNELKLVLLTPIIYRSGSSEPVSVKVQVSNSGNIAQNVTLVCKIPDPDRENVFIEKQAIIGIKKDSVFTFSYEPSAALSKFSNFTVNISGFRNPEKEIFSTTTLMVQNISGVQRYQDPKFSNYAQETSNEITASYRKVGDNAEMYQLLGSGGLNLPSGYLQVKGNISLLNNQKIPLVTNTNISLQQGSNQYSVGTVNKLLEMTMVGRGAEYSRTFANNKKIEIGFVDQSFNLIEPNSFLKYGYGFFTKGSINTDNTEKNASATYIYRYDPFEKSKHHLLGTEANYAFAPFWRVNGKLNTGLSSYETTGILKPSFSAESNYIGKIKNYNVAGNYFYSTDYYPGNRRGSMQFQQNISTEVKDFNFFTNIMVSNFSPRFYFFNRSQVSENSRIEVGTKFPQIKDFSIGLSYQYQSESSNSYNNFFGTWEDNQLRKLSANRLVEQISWSDYKRRQSAVLAVETGFVKYPFQKDHQFQLKLNANYSYKKFNLNTIYQSGSYFLSEYAFSYLTNQNVDYKKLSFSAFYNDSFLKDKLKINTGFSYVDDVIYGKSPSAFFNARYSTKSFSTFLNSSWYNFSAGSLSSNILTVELGVTVHLKKSVLNPGKKGKIQIFTFYDENNNNIFDPEEKQAAEYIVTINNVALKTNNEGTALYKDVPFGKYTLKQFIQQGWYYDERDFEVDLHSFPLAVPLHQNGTLNGKISFEYNSTTALEFEHRASSVSFNIIKDNQIVQRVVSDDEGKFNSFLPKGNYVVSINESSLPNNTFCEIKTRNIKINAGEITVLPDFIIKVKEKKINKKTFSN